MDCSEKVPGPENGFLRPMCPKSVPDTLSAPFPDIRPSCAHNAKRGLGIRHSTKIRGSLECGQEDRDADHYAIGLRPGPSPPPGEW